MNVDEGEDAGDGYATATPIFAALLAEYSLEWRPGERAPAWDPDAPNAWFAPATMPDPATVADPLR